MRIKFWELLCLVVDSMLMNITLLRCRKCSDTSRKPDGNASQGRSEGLCSRKTRRSGWQAESARVETEEPQVREGSCRESEAARAGGADSAAGISAEKWE